MDPTHLNPSSCPHPIHVLPNGHIPSRLAHLTEPNRRSLGKLGSRCRTQEGRRAGALSRGGRRAVRATSATGRSAPVYRVFSATGMSAPAPSFRGRNSSRRHAPRATAATTAASTIMLFTFMVFSPSSARGKPNAAGGCFRRPDFGHFASSAMPPAMQAHAKPILNQCMRVRERSAATEVGTARLAVEVGMGRSVCSSALRRSTNERISHFSPRLLLLHRTACSLSDSIRQVQCGIVMCIEITNRLQIFHVI